MSEKKLGQESAYPGILLDTYSGKPCGQEHGMSKRFYAACAAMQGILSSHKEGLYCNKQEGAQGLGIKEKQILNVNRLVQLSYRIADEMVEQENAE